MFEPSPVQSGSVWTLSLIWKILAGCVLLCLLGVLFIIGLFIWPDVDRALYRAYLPFFVVRKLSDDKICSVVELPAKWEASSKATDPSWVESGIDLHLSATKDGAILVRSVDDGKLSSENPGLDHYSSNIAMFSGTPPKFDRYVGESVWASAQLLTTDLHGYSYEEAEWSRKEAVQFVEAGEEVYLARSNPSRSFLLASFYRGQNPMPVYQGGSIAWSPPDPPQPRGSIRFRLIDLKRRIVVSTLGSSQHPEYHRNFGGYLRWASDKVCYTGFYRSNPESRVDRLLICALPKVLQTDGIQ